MPSALSIDHGDAVLRRFRAFGELSEADEAILQRLAGPSSAYPPMQRVRSSAGAGSELYVLHEGFVISSITLYDGSRQVLRTHIAGEVMGASGLPFEQPFETLTTVTAARISIVSASALGAVFAQSPRLGALLFLAAQEELAELKSRLVMVGRLNAKQRIAAFLVHMLDRVGPSDDRNAASFTLPITQGLIADSLGLTAIHVNRVLAQFEKCGLIVRDGRKFHFPDLNDLKSMSRHPDQMRARNHAWLPGA